MLSEAVSYNREFQAVIINECVESSRELELSQKMELLSQTALDTPLRKMKCNDKNCKRMEIYTDLKPNLDLMQTSTTSKVTISQLHGRSGKQSTSFRRGKLRFGAFKKKFMCPGEKLATKFVVNEAKSKDTFVIESRYHKGYYLTVRGCYNGSLIVLSKERDLNTRFYFGDNGKTLHSALCGDDKAVDLAAGQCNWFQQIFMWRTHNGLNQQWNLDDDGFLRVGVSPCKFGNLFEMVPLSLGDAGLILYPKLAGDGNDVFKWRFKDEKKLSIREMTCADVAGDAGLEVHANEVEPSDDYITSFYGSESTECPESYMMAGFECKETFCNELRLLCKKVEVSKEYFVFSITQNVFPDLYILHRFCQGTKLK